MIWVDWIVLIGTLLFIVVYGTLKTRKANNIEGYLMGDHQMKWATIGLSVMATQASAITFISTPGQAYESGMAFVQNYFGLPLALILVSAFFIPIYYKLKVFTAYEYLEKRFDVRIRLFTAFLFLLSRGLAAGITIYAPAIILSSILGWNLSLTILGTGILVIVYTVSGGTKAVSLTQKWQMGVIMLGMFIAFGLILKNLPEGIGFVDGLRVAGKMGRLNIIDFSLNLETRYTFWSGITGGLFLALSYFGTDQSQVQRYLGGKSLTESRLGLMFNALLKIPMQFFILLTGVMVFVFYQFNQPPLLFDQNAVDRLREGEHAIEVDAWEAKHEAIFKNKQAHIEDFLKTGSEMSASEMRQSLDAANSLRDEVKGRVMEVYPETSAKDSDFVFLTFILDYLPHGIIGLLMAVILSAAMSSTAGELNALGSTFTVDFYKRVLVTSENDEHYLKSSKVFTTIWGVLAILFALFASLLENLIEAVNILGSVFYGTILGVFLTAFMLKRVSAKPVFFAAILSQGLVFTLFFFFSKEVAYLWYNVIGCVGVLIIALILSIIPRLNNAFEADEELDG